MTDDEILDRIEAQRALNNRAFMKAWRLLFRVAPDEARIIQAEIRQGDLEISRLNGILLCAPFASSKPE